MSVIELNYTNVPAGNTLAVPDLSILNRTRQAPPIFPVELFRSGMDSWLQDSAHSAGAPLDYVAGTFLSAAASLIGSARWISPWKGWKEPAGLWIGLVGDPSSGKSPGSDPVLSLTHLIENEMSATFDNEYKEWETKKVAAKYAHEKWEKEVEEAIRFGKPAPIIPQEAIEPSAIIRPRILVNDSSIEKIALLLSSHLKGMLCQRDELSGWIEGIDRYNKGGERSFWIESYGGRPYKIDRVKHVVPIHIPSLLISIIGGIQPDKLKKLVLGADDGFVARFLWVWPEPIPPYRPQRQADHSLILKAMRRLTALQLDIDEQGSHAGRIVHLTESAAQAFQKWREQHFFAERNVTGMLKSAYGKAPGQLLRLALVMEYLWWVAYSELDVKEPEVISCAAIAAAAHLIESYFKPMAERVFSEAIIPEKERLTTALANYIVKTPAKVVNVRDITRQAKIPELRKSEKVEMAISGLIEADWLLPTAFTGDGRPRKDYSTTRPCT